jgi:hypothetical protein
VADEKSQISVVLNPQQLELYSAIDPALPAILVKAALVVNNQDYWFAMTQGAFGFILALAIIGGSIYLAMHGHDWVAGTLLGTGAIGMVTGFQISRLTGPKPASLPGQPKKRELPTT